MVKKWGIALGIVLGVWALTAFNSTKVQLETRTIQAEPEIESEPELTRAPSSVGGLTTVAEAAALRSAPRATSTDPQSIDRLVARALMAGEIDPSQAEEYRAGLIFEAEIAEEQETEELSEEY